MAYHGAQPQHEMVGHHLADCYKANKTQAVTPGYLAHRFQLAKVLLGLTSHLASSVQGGQDKAGVTRPR